MLHKGTRREKCADFNVGVFRFENFIAKESYATFIRQFEELHFIHGKPGSWDGRQNMPEHIF